MGSLEKFFNYLAATSRIHFEFGSWKMTAFASVSFFIVQTLPESTNTFVAVFPNTTGRLIASIEVVESAEDTDATQLSSTMSTLILNQGQN